MRDKRGIFLVTGIAMLVFGVLQSVHRFDPLMILISMVAFGVAFVPTFLLAGGGDTVRDEMVKRVNALSAYYSWITTFFCIAVLGIVRFFRLNLPDGLQLVIIMMVMAFSYILFRTIFLKRGRTE
jgi:hypothetical protein